jgi:hypothetical protein
MTKHQRLVQLLAEMTQAGTLQWDETGRDGIYSAPLANSGVLIKLISRTGAAADVEISLVNDRGQVVESFTDRDLDEGASEYYDLMLELFNNARSIALGSEKVMDDILGELEKRGR